MSVPAVTPTAFALTCRRCGRAQIVAVDVAHGDGPAVWRDRGDLFARNPCCRTEVFQIRINLELLTRERSATAPAAPAYL